MFYYALIKLERPLLKYKNNLKIGKKNLVDS
jgi:hypothetical protein